MDNDWNEMWTHWKTMRTMHMVGTRESLYSVKTSLGVPTIMIDLAVMSVIPSVNLHSRDSCL